ncbi:hypothetical protein [Streptomyces seoulensis]|uniref:hypothetical protein n=1 Tax=Streptomyces seoulensis TaxID=73044 RepID=UPI001FCD5134|nr:hypothetical protein [Streptomyces seoulensis]BDH08756.1 hypothetical protein HEK131_59830 [Streptomyces seoulensis]
MRNRMLRSVLVAAFSTVVAVGTLAGLSGATSAHEPGAGGSVTAAGVQDTRWDTAPLDTRWDTAPADTRWDVAPLDTRWD